MKNHRPLQLFSSDLDGTLIGDPKATGRFKKYWQSIPNTQRPVLCYNTGRFKEQVNEVIEHQALPAPDYLIAAVGTRLYKYGRNTAKEILTFRKRFQHGWDRLKIEQIMEKIEDVERQPDQFQNTHKSSWYFRKDAPELINYLENRFQEEGLDVSIVYSSSQDLDILPAKAGKGAALQWVCSRLNIACKEIVVAGNTGNDSSMFLLNDVSGILVSNAKAELSEVVDRKTTYRATQNKADGVIEGLEHFGFRYPAREGQRSA